MLSQGERTGSLTQAIETKTDSRNATHVGPWYKSLHMDMNCACIEVSIYQTLLWVIISQNPHP